jgi:hypothetical protein
MGIDDRIKKRKQIEALEETAEIVQSTTQEAPIKSTADARKEKVLFFISQGMSQRQASIMAGVDPATVARYKNLDPVFAHEIEQARLTYRMMLVDRVKIATETDWRAAKFLLETQFASEFGQKQQIELTNTDKPKSIIIDMVNQIRGIADDKPSEQAEAPAQGDTVDDDQG